NNQLKETLVRMFKDILSEVKEEKITDTYFRAANKKEYHAQVYDNKLKQLTREPSKG
ncbi:21335_t:CDS:1, partial [Racocetra persica]